MLTLDKIYHAAFVLKDVARKTDPVSYTHLTRQAIFWTRTAKRWALTMVRCGIPSASARALALSLIHI